LTVNIDGKSEATRVDVEVREGRSSREKGASKGERIVEREGEEIGVPL